MLEKGVNWPAPGTQFWKDSPRLAAMPLDIGRGHLVTTPKDSRPLDIVHFTAELAPIAKVGLRV
jgi:starch synthase